MLNQRRIPGAAHELREFRAIGDVDAVAGAMRLGRCRAPPRQIAAARPPATAVVLADRDHEHPGVVGPIDPVECAADRQLPAHVGLGFQRMPVDRQRETVQRATDAALEAWPIQEDARAVDPAGATFAVFELGEAFLALLVELPRLWRELLGELTHPLLVSLAGVERAMAAAAIGCTSWHDAVTAVTEDAPPARGQPREVTAEDLFGVSRIDELDPLAREVEPLLRNRGGSRVGRRLRR